MTRTFLIKTTNLIAIALAAFAVSAFANNDEVQDNQDGSLHESARAHHGGPGAHRRGGRGDHAIRKIVRDYVAEKKATGELDSYEFDVREEQLAQIREEVKAAREIKDRVTIQAKQKELRNLRAEQRNATRELVENNPELQQRIMEHRVERQERRKMHRKDRQEFLEFQVQKQQVRKAQQDSEQAQ